MLKGIGHDRERKYLLLCLQAWPPRGICDWEFMSGLNVKPSLPGEWGLCSRGSQSTYTHIYAYSLTQSTEFASPYYTWYVFPMSYRIPSFCFSDNSHRAEYESILKIVWQIIIFAPLNCQSASGEERAVKRKPGARGVWIWRGDFWSLLLACHSSLSSNHSFIMPARREAKGASSSHRGSFRQTAGGLSADPHGSGQPWHLAPPSCCGRAEAGSEGPTGDWWPTFTHVKSPVSAPLALNPFCSKPPLTLDHLDSFPLSMDQAPATFVYSSCQTSYQPNFYHVHWASNNMADF